MATAAAQHSGLRGPRTLARIPAAYSHITVVVWEVSRVLCLALFLKSSECHRLEENSKTQDTRHPDPFTICLRRVGRNHGARSFLKKIHSSACLQRVGRSRGARSFLKKNHVSAENNSLSNSLDMCMSCRPWLPSNAGFNIVNLKAVDHIFASQKCPNKKARE